MGLIYRCALQKGCSLICFLLLCSSQRARITDVMVMLDVSYLLLAGKQEAGGGRRRHSITSKNLGRAITCRFAATFSHSSQLT